MKLSMFIAACLGCVSAQAAVVGDPVEFGGRNYYLIKPDSGNAISWTDAQAAASTIPGANLVTINDMAENDFVQSLSLSSSNALLWLGLNDAAQEGEFSWISGENSSFTHWVPGEPNNQNGNEDYVHMYASGQWNDMDNLVSGSEPIFGVAEAPVPVPPAIWLFGSALALLGGRRQRR